MGGGGGGGQGGLRPSHFSGWGGGGGGGGGGLSPPNFSTSCTEKYNIISFPHPLSLTFRT